MRFGSLFAGIGGLDLGLERAGMAGAFQVEWDDYATKVLEKHWPTVPRWRDIREVNVDELPAIELLAGGFPCQPHSFAGKRLASADERDLWSEYARIIRGTRPRWVLAENVPGLLSSEGGRYYGRVLGDLADLGFDVVWQGVPAGAVGAPHRRGRVFIVAHAAGGGLEGRRLADRLHGAALEERAGQSSRGGPGSGAAGWSAWWANEPDVGRVAHGVPARVDRLRCLGNAVVPHVGEYVGRLIMAAEQT